ncbi:tRNA uridine-5-carboxymethylaminomethyl(34) synthesis GTPase MnmE [Sphingomonas sp. NSE70-1]|uniref:tRNA modification GTPase MnmE n=1 Tax=Sphingomonas caseinilyticus TaxID=2908205 RepID=A0ABT0RV47_9SPHN|nr:tRNA uridine-5-carboxymethylaminomethyl(34) synthesis GTPase MnmE [Sphingomonas caseinilyticus]MCL6698796.1 tRNA uridine-5-carboxymethylaminomethyl(34) synthesis GTPase MnmE [Sphingomonas caseinilyticus]
MSRASGDTIVALSSGRPPAAIAVVRTSGPAALEAAARLAGKLPDQRQASLRRLIDPRDGSLIDEALLLRFDAPDSATGENIVEYQCHGGRATVDALTGALLSCPGLRVAEPGEFTRRALANGRIDLTEAEGLSELLMAETELQRRSAIARAGGALRKRLDGWRDQLLALSAQAEVAIDYSDEDDGGSAPDLKHPIERLAADLTELVDAPRVEPLRDGIRVVVAGPPNAGKSSLVNALAQSEKAIVTHIAGTTRDVIEVPIAIDGIPFVLVDTAGLRESHDVVEAIGVGRAKEEAERADILLWLGAEDPIEHPDLIRIAAKSDLGMAGEGMAVSAVSGAGLTELMQALVGRAGALLPKADELTLDRRQHDLLAEAQEALQRGAQLDDPVLVAEELRNARLAVDRISGRAGVEDLLDALFGRFCLGK